MPDFDKILSVNIHCAGMVYTQKHTDKTRQDARKSILTALSIVLMPALLKHLLQPCNCLKHITGLYNCQCANCFLTAHAFYFALYDVFTACAVLLTV